MVHGIGVDIVKIDRIREAVDRWGKRFLDRVFTSGEIQYCFARKEPYPSLSVRFAAKEAFLKALGGGSTISMKDIEVLTLPGGRPYINTKGRLGVLLVDRSVEKIHLSLSHEKEYGVASIVLEGGIF